VWLFTDDAGNFYKSVPGSGVRTQVTLPSGVAQRTPAVRPKFSRYRRLLVVAGKYNPMMLWTILAGNLYKIGITAPSAAPTLAAGAAGAVTGIAIGRYTFAHYEGSTLIHESDPSPASASVSLTAQQRSWSGLPGSSGDSRVTHVHLYVSMDGSLSYRAAKIAVSATTHVENMATSTLYQQTSLPVKNPGTPEQADDLLARGVPPYAIWATPWHSRTWYIDPLRPGVSHSRTFEPESVDPSNFLPTDEGEGPLALGAMDDELVVFCERKVYSVQSWGSTFRMRKVSDSYSLVAPHSILNIQGMLWFAAEQGISGYVGGGGNGFRNLMARSRRNAWIADYKANRQAYEDGIADDDRVNGCYLFATARETEPKTVTWVGYYRAMAEEGAVEPYWGMDKMNRKRRALGNLFAPSSRAGLISFGDCDGYVRQENAANGDDDGDTYGKRLRIQHKHFVAGDQSGDDAHGSSWGPVDWFGRNDNGPVDLKTYCGDDAATESPADETVTFPAGAQPGRKARTSHQGTLVKSAGKGVTVEITAATPVDVRHRGVTIHRQDGEQVF